MGETICQLCGDVGAQNALVFCVRCLDFAIHRYCLDVIPETLNEFVRWFCVDCDEEYGKPCPDKEPFSVPSTKLATRSSGKFPSLRTKPMKMKHNKLKNGSSQHELIPNVTKEKERKETSRLVKVTGEKRYLRPPKIKNVVAKSDKMVHDCPTKVNKSDESSLFVSPVDVVTGPEEKKDQYSPCEGDNENMIFEERKLCTAGADVATKEKERKENSCLVKGTAEKRYLRLCKIENKVAKSDKVVHDCPTKANKSEKSSPLVSSVDVVTDPKEKKDQYSPCEGGNENAEIMAEWKLCTAGSDVAEISLESEMIPVNSSNILQDGQYIRVQPVIDQIWRGSLDIETDGRGLYDGLVAHLSNKACPKVWEEASLLSESICMELVPKKSIWPKRFQKSKPSDENIALYFFPLVDQKSCIKVYDKLVSEMLSHELALKAVVTNAQLLVFTSYELPDTYWKFEGKFYLWGVFVAKQAAVSDSSAKNEPMISNGEENMAIDSLSPISTLNNISSSGLRWTLPEVGELKLNVDASFNRDTREGAIGGLIRDKEGNWVHGFYMHLGQFNPETAEICAIFKGLGFAWKLGNIHKLTLESNSEKAIEAVSSASSDHPCYCDIEFIRRRLMDSKWSCWIKLINREANTCANRLAQEAFNSLRTKELRKPPEFMLEFLASDLQLDGKSCHVV